jgi:hypothetical protein
MQATHFFAVPDFLELLQFWDSCRTGRPLPDWNGDMSAVPHGLLPNLILSDRRGEPTYAFVGATVIRRWGWDPTGRRIYADVARGAHGRYLQSVVDEMIARRAPIFSAAVYQPDSASVLMTGRLYVPFTWQGSDDIKFVMTLQLFTGSEHQMKEVGLNLIVHEIRRDVIAIVPELCARLAAARRHYQISRHTHQRTLAQDIDTIAHELTGSALIPLPCLDEPDPIATA